MPICWVYLRSEPGLWTVGYYQPDGGWVAESDHASAEAAAARVHYLNVGDEHFANAALITADPDLLAACRLFLERWQAMTARADVIDGIVAAVAKAEGRP